MHKNRVQYSTRFSEEAPPATRCCDMPTCSAAGEYRAPKGRERLNEYFWFCLEHVREYNKAWDYYAGMSEREIERHVRSDVTWQRPTWPMGFWRTRERTMHEEAMRQYGFRDAGDGARGNGRNGHADGAANRMRTPEEEALADLDLEPPVDFARIKAMALNDPKALHALLSVNTDAVIAYLAAQRAAGAQALQVFDTWGGVLSPAMYREFSLPYLTRIAQELPRGDGADRTPLILFGKGNAAYLDDLSRSGAEGVGVDWLIELGDAARRTQGRVALQGNLDPTTLYGAPDAIRAQVRHALDSYRDGNNGSRDGHVFNLGHGMSPDMNPDHVGVLVDEVHAYSAR